MSNFNKYEQLETLSYVRSCIERELLGLPLLDYPKIAKLDGKSGVFILLRRADGSIRSCFGNSEGVESVGKALQRHALNVAFASIDTPPINLQELNEAKIEVSIVKLVTEKDFKLGLHGIILCHENRRAVFLPEVAVEQKWSEVEVFNNLAKKINLSDDQLAKAKIILFETQRFEENI